MPDDRFELRPIATVESALEAVDGTPVLDVKPVLRSVSARSSANQPPPGWTSPHS